MKCLYVLAGCILLVADKIEAIDLSLVAVNVVTVFDCFFESLGVYVALIGQFSLFPIGFAN